MQSHTLKTQHEYWWAVKRGFKTFEVRKNDRGFQTGDELILVRLPQDGEPDNRYMDDQIYRRVAYMLQGGQHGIEPGYCVLGLVDETTIQRDKGSAKETPDER